MEEYLEDTYGITVYQEQVMLLSQSWQALVKAMPTCCVRQWVKSRSGTG
jgi:hypothetical protein